MAHHGVPDIAPSAPSSRPSNQPKKQPKTNFTSNHPRGAAENWFSSSVPTNVRTDIPIDRQHV
jgi:hypothetical protein